MRNLPKKAKRLTEEIEELKDDLLKVSSKSAISAIKRAIEFRQSDLHSTEIKIEKEERGD